MLFLVSDKVILITYFIAINKGQGLFEKRTRNQISEKIRKMKLIYMIKNINEF